MSISEQLTFIFEELGVRLDINKIDMIKVFNDNELIQLIEDSQDETLIEKAMVILELRKLIEEYSKFSIKEESIVLPKELESLYVALGQDKHKHYIAFIAPIGKVICERESQWIQCVYFNYKKRIYEGPNALSGYWWECNRSFRIHSFNVDDSSQQKGIGTFVIKQFDEVIRAINNYLDTYINHEIKYSRANSHYIPKNKRYFKMLELNPDENLYNYIEEITLYSSSSGDITTKKLDEFYKKNGYFQISVKHNREFKKVISNPSPYKFM